MLGLVASLLVARPLGLNVVLDGYVQLFSTKIAPPKTFMDPNGNHRNPGLNPNNPSNGATWLRATSSDLPANVRPDQPTLEPAHIPTATHALMGDAYFDPISDPRHRFVGVSKRLTVERQGETDTSPSNSIQPIYTDAKFPRRTVLQSLVGIGTMGPAVQEAQGAYYIDLMVGPSSTDFLKAVQEIAGPHPKALSSYQSAFIVYLTGFLINFDPQFKLIWQDQARTIRYRRSPVVKSVYVQFQFFKLAEAIELQVTNIRAKQLTDLLWDTYAEQSTSSLHQLRLIFSLMGEENQPRERIAQGLQMELMRENKTLEDLEGEHLLSFREDRLVDVESQIIGLVDNFKPPVLLPDTLCPKFDESRKRWVVPDPGVKQGAPFTAAAFDADGPIPSMPRLGLNMSTWFILAIAGGLASCTTHLLVQPVDVARTKTEMAAKSSKSFWGTAGRVIIREGKARRTYLRNEATLIGRFSYGMSIYPGFELTKLWLAGKVGVLIAVDYRFGLVVISSFIASLFSVLNLAPFEALKVRVYANQDYCKNLTAGFSRLVHEEGVDGLYSNYRYILFRVVTFNVAEFLVFDYFNDVIVFFFPTLLPAPRGVRAALALLKGALAGILGVVVSQPVDAAINRAAQSGMLPAVGPKLSIPQAGLKILEESGIGGLYSSSQARFVWAISVISIEFFLYDGLKEALVEVALQGVTLGN